MKYQVKQWDQFFESAKSKTYDNKSLCMMPTKHGLGYRHLVRDSNGDGPAIFGAWCAMIQVISTHAKPRRGYCTDTGRMDGRPLTPHDLELLTDIPACVFEKMLAACSAEPVAWLDVIDRTDTARIPQCPQGIPSTIKHSDSTHTHTQGDESPDGSSQAAHKPTALDQEFAEAWTLYPDKSGKDKARKAYIAARKAGVTQEAILAGINRYMAYVTQRRKHGFPDLRWKNGSTWFGQKGWEDEYTVNQPEKKSGPAPLANVWHSDNPRPEEIGAF